MTDKKRFGILVAGGPAPGINSVIAAATIRAKSAGYEVLGFRDGFSWLMQGDTEHAEPLDFARARRIANRGGSDLGISRANPTKDPKKLETVLATLDRLGVDKLITIGGDDTAFSAYTVEKAAGGRVRVAHVPKTIDNDLDLPADVPTFGFQTAHDLGVRIVENLLVDAQTTTRWYVVVAMGRKAGHLALGMGKAAGASLTLIAEELEHAGKKVNLASIVDTVTASIVKRLAEGDGHGVAVLAEGLVEFLEEKELESLASSGAAGAVERDAHGHIRMAELPFGDIVKAKVQERLAALGISMTLVSKNIGYELRCADPVPFDLAYTKDLGYAAAELLIAGGSAAMVTVHEGKLVPKPFADIMDPKTGRMRVRMVDTKTDTFRVAVDLMSRLRTSDLEDAEKLARIAKAAKLEPEAFKREFGGVAV